MQALVTERHSCSRLSRRSRPYRYRPAAAGPLRYPLPEFSVDQDVVGTGPHRTDIVHQGAGHHHSGRAAPRLSRAIGRDTRRRGSDRTAMDHTRRRLVGASAYGSGTGDRQRVSRTRRPAGALGGYRGDAPRPHGRNRLLARNRYGRRCGRHDLYEGRDPAHRGRISSRGTTFFGCGWLRSGGLIPISLLL